jgi:hypothetical protein
VEHVTVRPKPVSQPDAWEEELGVVADEVLALQTLA